MLFYGSCAIYASVLTDDWNEEGKAYVYYETSKAARKVKDDIGRSLYSARRALLPEILMYAAYSGQVPNLKTDSPLDPRRLEEAPTIHSGGDATVALAAYVFQIMGAEAFTLESLAPCEAVSTVTTLKLRRYTYGAENNSTLFFEINFAEVDKLKLKKALSASMNFYFPEADFAASRP